TNIMTPTFMDTPRFGRCQQQAPDPLPLYKRNLATSRTHAAGFGTESGDAAKVRALIERGFAAPGIMASGWRLRVRWTREDDLWTLENSGPFELSFVARRCSDG